MSRPENNNHNNGWIIKGAAWLDRNWGWAIAAFYVAVVAILFGIRLFFQWWGK